MQLAAVYVTRCKYRPFGTTTQVFRKEKDCLGLFLTLFNN